MPRTKRASDASTEDRPAKRAPRKSTSSYVMLAICAGPGFLLARRIELGNMNKATLATLCYFLERMKDRVDNDAEAEVVKLKSENAKLQEELCSLRELLGGGQGEKVSRVVIEFAMLTFPGAVERRRL